MQTALVLDGGSGPALAVTRSLGRAGWRVIVPAGTRSAWSRYAAAAVEMPDAADRPEAFVGALARALDGATVDIVVPCTDASAELLWAHSELRGDVKVLGGDRRSFELGSDKLEGLRAAERAGFGVPAWAAPTDVRSADAELERIGLPCVIKPRRSYVAEGPRLLHRRHVFVHDRAELAGALAARADADGSLPLVQAYVPGRSLSVSAVLRDGVVLAYAARETLSFDPIIGGTSVWKRTIPPNDVGVQEALDLLRAVEFEGLAEVEYQVDASGRERLVEIGARAHGWLTLAVAAGADLPLIAARALLGEDVPVQSTYRVGVEMRWPAGEVARMRAALVGGSALPPGVRRRDVVARAWPPWRPGMLYDGLSREDVTPWLPARLRGRSRHAPVVR